VINEDIGYLHEMAKCRFIDGVFDLARGFADAGYVVVIVTNQSGIGRGYYTEADFHTLMRWMCEEFRRQGAPVAAVYHCPDHPVEALGAYRRDTPRRKPGPGMFLEAGHDLGLDLRHSWSVGDKMSDIEAGRAAGIGNLIKYDPLAAGVAKCQDFWLVPRLSVITELLVRTSG
jgi:D-glycero-D-manno-heptose 1,7-bisphosphate phosphatase